jgi:hypothetical protein
VFGTAPTSGQIPDNACTGPITVEIRKWDGTVDTGNTSAVTLSISDDTGMASITENAATGIATFNTCVVKL